MREFTKDEVNEYFRHGIDCGQVVLLAFEEEIGLPREVLLRIGSPFGGGCFQASTCGSVNGAYMVLGLLYGHEAEDQEDRKNDMIGKMFAFNAAFEEEQKSLVCKDILGYDLTKEDEMAQIAEQNLLFEICPEAVICAIRALKRIVE